MKLSKNFKLSLWLILFVAMYFLGLYLLKNLRASYPSCVSKNGTFECVASPKGEFVDLINAVWAYVYPVVTLVYFIRKFIKAEKNAS